MSISRIKFCSLTPHHGKTAVMQRSRLLDDLNEVDEFVRNLSNGRLIVNKNS